MFTAVRRVTARMAILALALLWLDSTARGAGSHQQPGIGRAVIEAANEDSELEVAFSRRAGKAVRLFGYDVFAASGAPLAPAFGTAQNDYLLGPGDEVRVTIHGGKYDSNRRYTVNSNGDVIIDQLRPLAAAGRTLGELRHQIEMEVGIAMSGHEAFVSLDGMRRMGILVTGAVTRPGRHEVPGSATLFDALMAAGGVDKLGSLRDIRLVRSGSALSIDFYGLLQGVDGTDPALRDGDRIVVPPIGPTIAMRVLSNEWQGEFCRCSIDVIGGKQCDGGVDHLERFRHHTGRKRANQ